jgi:hypothetical protein
VSCPTTRDPAPPSPASISTAQQHVYVFAFVAVEWGVCAHGGACVFLVQSCIMFSREWLVVPRVTHARLLPSPYRQRSSVYMYLYLWRWSGACVDTGSHAARRQPCFRWVVAYLICFYVGEWLVACGTTCDPSPPPPVSLLTAQQRVHLFVIVEVVRGVREHRDACCTSTTMAFRGPLCVSFILCGWVACGTTCDQCLPPPVSILTAQQRVHLFVFVEVERGVCGHRGACCVVPTFLCGQFCVFFILCGWVGGLWHRVWPMPASSRLHINSAAACVFFCICRGGVGRAQAQGRMLCGVNLFCVGSFVFHLLFIYFVWVGGLWHRV